MDAFHLRDQLVEGFRGYIKSFVDVRDPRLRPVRDDALASGLFWPEPLLQLNPNFAPGGTVPELVREGLLHPECERIFQASKTAAQPLGRPLRLYRHQVDAIRAARAGRNCGSGPRIADGAAWRDLCDRHPGARCRGF